MSKPVTMQDLANRLGISKVAVSKALRGQTDIGEATRARVVALAEELGYRPNIIARKLSAKQTRTIGLVVPKIAHHFLTQAIDSIYSTANLRDYEIVMMVSEEDDALEQRHLETLLSMRVDGLLISVTEQTTNLDIFRKISKRGTPLVFFDRVIEDVGFTCISSADHDGSVALVNHAIEQGYQRIGHIGGYQNVSIGRNRYQGYRKALTQHNLSVHKDHLVFGGFSEADGNAGLQTIYDSGSLPDMIFAVTYPVALGVLNCARQLGIRIPDDLDLICFGNSDYNAFITPSITGIYPPAPTIGATALEHLLALIETPESSSIENVIVPVDMVYADTCIKKSKKIEGIT